MSLAKQIVLILQIIACTAGLMTNAKSKRSPDGFSLFGLSPRFSVPNTISRAQRPLDTISHLFTPPLYQHTNEEMLHKPVKNPSAFNNNEPYPYDKSTYPSPIRNPYVKENAENSYLDDFVKPNTVREYVKSENIATYRNSNQENNTNVQIVDKSEMNNKENITNNPFEEFMGLDQDLINSIFRTTTEDNTIDYTTATGDYETSTIDEFLRIPAAAVATLLGK